MPTSKKYASFGRRLLALIIDNILFSITLSPLFMMIFDYKEYTDEEIRQIITTQGPLGLIEPKQMVIQLIVTLAITVFFWIRFAGTPGKRLLKMKVVDATTGKNLTILQSTTRYLGYMMSAFPMGLGFIWIIIDKRNQGWHDKLANSVVVCDEDASEISEINSNEKNHSPINHTADDDVFRA